MAISTTDRLSKGEATKQRFLGSLLLPTSGFLLKLNFGKKSHMSSIKICGQPLQSPSQPSSVLEAIPQVNACL